MSRLSLRSIALCWSRKDRIRIRIHLACRPLTITSLLSDLNPFQIPAQAIRPWQSPSSLRLPSRPLHSVPQFLIMPYRLSASLRGHKADVCFVSETRFQLVAHYDQVRAVSSPNDDLILSASRDTTAIYWSRHLSSVQFTQNRVYKPGPRFVSSVTYIPPQTEAPQGECASNIWLI